MLQHAQQASKPDEAAMIPLCRPAIGPEEIQAVISVLESGWLAHGEQNHIFEEAFCSLLGVKHAISLNSCTSALQLAIQGLGITGEVIVPSFTFVASVNAIIRGGATPVFVDVNQDTRNITLDSIRNAFGPRTQAIMPVHYGGLPAPMVEIMQFADAHGLQVIEDSAECLGATIHNKQAGSFGVGCFSFFPTKNITTGEGGMLTTNDDRLAKHTRTLMAHGIETSTYSRANGTQSPTRVATQAGYNFRMCSILATIGVEQMKKLPMLNMARERLATMYLNDLASLARHLKFPCVPTGFTHSWQMFTLLVLNDRRDELLDWLNSNKVGASVHWNPPVHLQPVYKSFQCADSLEETKFITESILTLPLYPSMRDQDVGRVCDLIHHFYKPYMDN